MKSGKNYFVCNRSLFKNPLWYAEKFTKGQAWVDLFGKANHSDGWFEKNGQRVDVKRGQTGRSIETLAEDWKWSRNKVKRFLKRLKDDHMIDHKTNHLTSIITICNYEEQQFSLKQNELPNEPSNELPDELQTNKNKTIINKELIKSIIDYLNQKLKTNYKPGTDKTKSCINARINEGNQFDQFKTVIDKKYDQWFGTDDAKYLRPETLFGTKFEGYLNQLNGSKSPTVKKLTLERFKKAIQYKIDNHIEGEVFKFKDESLNKITKKHPFITEYPFNSVKFDLAFKEYQKL